MVPLDVRFQSMPRDEQVVWEIDAQMAELDDLYDSIIGCDATVHGPKARHEADGRFEVEVVLALPCREIHVDCGGNADANVYVAVEKAFASVRSQLLQWLDERHRVSA